MRRLRDLPAATWAGGLAVVLAGVAGAAIRRRPTPASPPLETPSPSAPAAIPERTDPLRVALRDATREPQLPQAVADAYRHARRAFNATRHDGTDETRADLRQAAWALWAVASVAEPFAAAEGKTLSRGARALVDLLDEHRDLGRLAAASAEGRPRHFGDAVGEHARQRRTRLERRIADRGKRLFASKPARVAGRIADDRPR